MRKRELIPLSETMHYILLSVRTPLHGYGMMEWVLEMSEQEVNLAAGTLYGAIENLKKNGYIELISPLNERKKVYQITHLGEKILAQENERLKRIVNIYESGSDANHDKN